MKKKKTELTARGKQVFFCNLVLYATCHRDSTEEGGAHLFTLPLTLPLTLTLREIDSVCQTKCRVIPTDYFGDPWTFAANIAFVRS